MHSATGATASCSITCAVTNNGGGAGSVACAGVRPWPDDAHINSDATIGWGRSHALEHRPGLPSTHCCLHTCDAATHAQVPGGEPDGCTQGATAS